MLAGNLIKSRLEYVYNYTFTKLRPFTKYEATVAAGNRGGFSEAVSVMFTTAEAGEKIFYIITTVKHAI